MNPSIKKYALPVALLLLMLAFLEMCTLVNVVSPAFLQSPKHLTYPLLKDGAESENYEMLRISDYTWPDISYSPSKDYFLIIDSHFRKIDAQGNEIFTLSRGDNLTGYYTGPHNIRYTPYVVTSSGIYDFSEPIITANPIAQILNGDSETRFTKDYWQKLYADLYELADVVVYGRINKELDRYPAYFKIRDIWVVLYASKDQINIESDGDVGTIFAGYPGKFEQMVFLKDTRENIYSNTSYLRLARRGIAMNDRDYTYPRGLSVRMLSFRKEIVNSNIIYTPIPMSYRGLASYLITAGTEKLYFREIATRDLVALPESRVKRFVLPHPYFENTDVSFLAFSPQSNVANVGGGGVYVIRPKP